MARYFVQTWSRVYCLMCRFAIRRSCRVDSSLKDFNFTTIFSENIFSVAIA